MITKFQSFSLIHATFRLVIKLCKNEFDFKHINAGIGKNLIFHFLNQTL